MNSTAIYENNATYQAEAILSPAELYRLQLALESKISDDMAYIRIVQDEIKTNHNHFDKRYLEEGREILRKDLALKEKIIEMRYRCR